MNQMFGQRVLGFGGKVDIRPFPMEAVQYTLNTSTGNQDITLDASIGKGKTPIAAMFALGRNSDSVGEMSVGFFDGTTSIVVASMAENGKTTTNTVTWGATDECLMRINSGGVVIEAAGVALIENGVRINIGATNGAALPGTCYLFFDADGAAKVDTFTSHATENSSVTVTPGIAADALVTLNPSRTENWFDDAAHDSAIMGPGFVVRGGSQNSVKYQLPDGASTTETFERIATTLGAVTSVGSGFGLEFGNFTATQFDATTRGNTGGGTHGYLALEMPNAQFWTGVIDTPTSVSEPSYTSPNFPVQSLLTIPTIAESVNSSVFDRTAECFGVAAATKRGVSSVTVASEDNVGTSDTESHYNASTIRAAGADDYNESEADSFTTIPTGFKLNFTTAHSTAQKWPVLAIGRA